MHTSRIIRLMYSTNCCTAAGRLAASDSSWILDHSRSLTVQWSSSVVCPNFACRVIVFISLWIFTTLSAACNIYLCRRMAVFIDLERGIKEWLLSNCVLHHGTCIGRLQHSRNLGIALFRNRVWSWDLHNKKDECYPFNGNVLFQHPAIKWLERRRNLLITEPVTRWKCVTSFILRSYSPRRLPNICI